ncbi:MAG TPA: pyridoxamine 5'-phosphate oxidase [Oceanospirillales bacterium]|nr:pyridoxamine 5'-phosphate oxidase [Oceanospirillaceae bacterium]MAR01776.1 pyridoxamine 5'-phosphate oxidase [Oceanospirillaceae bacterium]HBS42030.1 pyridoxamine 5'-phosphate oxidase [Oceanospirillales bacterium]|tara:strand:- start:396 stop:1058 length:663 start_codon:yes stop_codon:yes gene_type:complete
MTTPGSATWAYDRETIKVKYASDIAFTETVKAIQARKGSRQLYARMEQQGGWQTDISSELAAFVARQRSFYLATANADGQPYIQHRGGPPGFLKVIDKRTLVFADFRGNRQYISQGNLADNPRAFIFLMDYYSKIRFKLWGQAEVIEDQPDLLAALMSAQGEYPARGEQVVIFRVDAWDRNCPQHIPQWLDPEQAEALLAGRDQRIAELEEQVSQLKARG